MSGLRLYKFLPRERSIIKTFVHPHTIAVYDTKNIDGHVYIFMEICDGDLLSLYRTEALWRTAKPSIVWSNSKLVSVMLLFPDSIFKRKENYENNLVKDVIVLFLTHLFGRIALKFAIGRVIRRPDCLGTVPNFYSLSRIYSKAILPGLGQVVMLYPDLENFSWCKGIF
jgi:hypothetical protein